MIYGFDSRHLLYKISCDFIAIYYILCITVCFFVLNTIYIVY